MGPPKETHQCCRFVLPQINHNKSKNTELKLVGLPVLSQLLGLIDKGTFKTRVKQTSSDYYYKRFKSWTHLVTMVFGILSRCDSMGEVCEGLKGMSGKLQHLGLESSPSKAPRAVVCGTEITCILKNCITSWWPVTKVFCRTIVLLFQSFF